MPRLADRVSPCRSSSEHTPTSASPCGSMTKACAPCSLERVHQCLVPARGCGQFAARFLHPSFVEHLDGSSLAEVRRRRDEALAEREFQSYLRRLVQVRQDILRSERERRAAGGVSAPLVERLTSVLSTGPTGTGRGE